MDYVTIGALLVAAAGVLAGIMPGILEDRREKRKLAAEEAEQKREHETTMRQAEIAQSLMYNAMNYDFVRDTIAGGVVEPEYMDRVAEVLDKPAAP